MNEMQNLNCEYSYYGRGLKLIGIGVSYFMIDEHIKKIIDKNEENLKSKTNKILKEGKENYEKELIEIKRAMTKISLINEDLFKKIDIVLKKLEKENKNENPKQ